MSSLPKPQAFPLPAYGLGARPRPRLLPRGEPGVLLIDDDHALGEAAQSIGALGCELVIAATPEAAEQALHAARRYSIVLCSHDMRGIDAVKLLSRVRAERSESVRMLLSACSDPRVAAQALSGASIFRFIPKPIEALELHAELAAGQAEFSRRARAAERNGRYQFMTRALSGFAERLDMQLGWQLRRIRHFVDYANALGSLHSLDELAERAVVTGRELLLGRKFELDIRAPAGVGVDLSPGRAGERFSEEALVQPLETADGRIGELRMSLAPGERLSSADAELVAALAGYTAVAAWCLVRQRQHCLAQHAAITAIARLAERRDDETGKHIERVSEYSRMTAEALRANGCHVETITDAYIDELVRSAPLHDIGKVGIPDAILLKPGRLTSEEWEIMKTHAAIGAETLRQATAGSMLEGDFLRLGIEIAGSHHEKWDGSGYPGGLRGPAIPLSARIVALADCYDALTTVRPYKQAWTHAAAMDYLVQHSGTQFDPDVVAAFCSRAAEADAIRARLADAAAA
ncbi:MAG: HD domain-containing protein [Planctomycetes bacterium]|nr:HD domain-containing protein [Planctomycetota bacterium]